MKSDHNLNFRIINEQQIRDETSNGALLASLIFVLPHRGQQGNSTIIRKRVFEHFVVRLNIRHIRRRLPDDLEEKIQ